MSTLVILSIVQTIIHKVSAAFFLKSLPEKRYPVGSREREEKATMLSERAYKLIIYITTTSLLFVILKNGTFLHVYIGGD